MASKKKATAAKKAPAKAAAKRPAAKARRNPLKITDIAPSLTVNDIERSIAWYRDVLGFNVGNRWENNGVLMGVELSAGENIFMLAQDDWQKGRDRVKGQGVRLYCTTRQDIDKLAASIKAQGGKLAQAPTNQPWGMRDIAIDDPDGYKITIGANLKKKR